MDERPALTCLKNKFRTMWSLFRIALAMASIVENIRNFVEDECKKPTSKYGYEPFYGHFEPVVKYALELSDEFG
jgi:hypothetical protein